MDVIRDLRGFEPSSRGAVVTIGAYDGVHLGHRAVLRIVHDLALARGHEAVCLTFDRHPAEVVRPDRAPTLLTDLEQKLELLGAVGHLDRTCVLPFDEARSREPADEFVRDVVVSTLGARLVVVGADFHFGYHRHGNVHLLEQMGAELGFEVLGLGLVAIEGDHANEPYSSTGIRSMLAAGRVREAAEMFARPPRHHEVRGVVEAGDQRGRAIGFPTANVAVPDRICLPGDGVYAGTFVDAEGVERPAAISLGRRPTFYEDHGLLLLEAFVLDFDGDLYGQPVKVRFHEQLRGQERFESVDALVEQMHRDVAACRAVLQPLVGEW